MGDELPHAKLHSYGSRGAYSSKAKICEKAVDTMGKITEYKPSPYLPAWATAPKRDAYKGKQLAVPFASDGFGKVEYVACPYEDKAAKKKDGKLGFCTSKSFGRDDVANMLDTLRYRHALEKEARYTKAATEAAAAKALSDETLRAGADAAPSSPGLHADAASRTASSLDRSLSSTAAGSPGRKLGLSGKVPQFTSNFDRTRHVAEFVPKVAYAERHHRDYGPMSTSSASFGEGCAELAALDSPKHPKRDFTKAFNDKAHLVAPVIGGRAAL